MNIQIIGRDYYITNAIREFISDKLDFLNKFTDDIVYVTLSKEGDNHKIDIEVKYKGSNINMSEINDDLYIGIDVLKDRLFTTLTRKKQMLIDNEQKTMKEYFNNRIESQDNNIHEDIIKIKQFYLKPMFVEEAILQMDMLKHSFFVFLNADTMEQNVLYKRKDGKYGLIETKLA